MADKQQIEEMAKDCYYVAHLVRLNDPYMLSLKGWRMLTEEMIKLGWVKPSQDSMVLTKEEKQRLLHEMYEQGRFDAIAELDMPGTIVVSQEEYDKLNEQIKRYKDEREFIGKCMIKNTRKYVELTSDFTDMLDKIYEHACQETANKIFTKLIEVARNNNDKLSIGLLKAWGIEFDAEVEE